MLRVKRRHWNLLACLALLTMCMGAATPGLAAAQPLSFEIAAGAAPDTLRDFGRQSGLQMLFEHRVVAERHTQPVLGEFEPETALQMLLSGSGLVYEFVNERTVAIRSAETVRSESAVSPGDRLRLAQASSRSSPGAESEGKSAEAQSNDDLRKLMVEEVVVTATKRQESVRDVPMSIAVITNHDIERRGLIGMEDYLRSIPGVNQIDQGPTGNAIVIRGITTSPEEENFSSGTTVATYFGETPITGAGGALASGIDVRPVDIERIEVLRGPQGTAFGSASLGGTLRIIPATPKLDGSSARLAANYSNTSGLGSENSMVQGVVNIPVIVDKLALRAVGYRYDDSGFYRNIAGIDPQTIATAENFGLGDHVNGFTQDDVGRAISSGGRLAALWQATDKLDLSLNFLSQTIEQDGVPAANTGNYEQMVVPIAPQGRVRGEDGEAADTEIDLLSFVLNYNLGWATLTSAASWVDSGSARNRDLTRTFGFPNSTTLSSDFKSFTAETRLASQFDGRFRFLGGLFYENVDDDSVQTLDWPGAPAASPAGTNPMAVIDLARRLDQRAVFGEVSYDLTDRLTATVGGRFFEYDKNETQLSEGGFFGTPLGTGVPSSLDSSESNSSFKANLSFEPTDDSLLYVSWAEGFRLGRPSVGLPPGVCDVDSDGLVDGTGMSIESTRSVNSDFLENYEIGGKLTLFDRRMVVDTSVYHIKWDGLPVRAVAPCNQAYVANVGAATSDGVEFQVSLFLMDGLRVDFGGSYNEAELSEDAPGLVPPAFKGDRLPGSPRASANLAAQYDFELIGHKAFVRADSLYAGKFYGDFLQSPITMAGDYIKVDARAGVTIRNLSLELFVRNLTNEDAFTWRGISAFPSYSSAYQLRPRTVGVQLGYQFN